MAAAVATPPQVPEPGAPVPSVAKPSSADHAALAEWRRQHGETPSGRPFYDLPQFPRLCQVFNASKKKAELCPTWVKNEDFALTPELVEHLHRQVMDAEEGETSVFEAWDWLCGLLKKALGIHGAMDAPDRQTGDRAVHVAAAAGHVQNLRWLAQHGADVNAASAPALELSPKGDMSKGLRPAHVAAAHGQVGALACLAEAGADLNAKRWPDGATPLDFARDGGHADAAAWLEAKGAQGGSPP
uniref:Uncharacterized protein n=1 Tax=Zooxanthella nutricula TaxID=1333877 RepID=A0A7S2MHP3_9DINO